MSHTNIQQLKPWDAAWWMGSKVIEFKGGSMVHLTWCQAEEAQKSTARIKWFSNETTATHL